MGGTIRFKKYNTTLFGTFLLLVYENVVNKVVNSGDKICDYKNIDVKKIIDEEKKDVIKELLIRKRKFVDTESGCLEKELKFLRLILDDEVGSRKNRRINPRDYCCRMRESREEGKYAVL